ncbi:MAG: GTPase ObgE [Bacteroidales bacterium]|jgi:GTP-binding protein|nr:GTPase ObgE [Bacteroidales bacterium]NLK79452.1 GTPase ObgE [Bacteroidales bacterium]HKM31056.1 GTPase ObgE [Bacteroidales bacterium]
MSDTNFVDYVKIFCASGKGGAGSAHLMRAKYVPKGGPDGGDGGRGGHIILRVNPQFWTLIHLKYKKHIRAGHGEPGKGNCATGADGKDVWIEVPEGTVVKREDSEDVLAELTEPGQEYTLCTGGKGGLGNTHFKSPTRQTPRYAQPGLEGEEGWFILELKLLADVGLVGFPNAGKSTLLSAVSAARPKIADYPFTTLVPQLGIVALSDHRSFVMADIPGIIEGAHRGKGLGIRFLRHIERNSMLLFIVPATSPDIKAEYNVLLEELRKYKPELLDKQRMLAVTKTDLLDSESEKEIAKHIPRSLPVVLISSVTGKNITLLKEKIWDLLSSQ